MCNELENTICGRCGRRSVDFGTLARIIYTVVVYEYYIILYSLVTLSSERYTAVPGIQNNRHA